MSSEHAACALDAPAMSVGLLVGDAPDVMASRYIFGVRRLFPRHRVVLVCDVCARVKRTTREQRVTHDACTAALMALPSLCNAEPHI